MYCEDRKYREWITSNVEVVPQIDFTKYEGLLIQPLPAFSGAFIRFRAIFEKKEISIYLDIDDSLGCMMEPYWEAYPFEYDDYQDTYRDTMDNTKLFFDAVYEELKK